MLIVAFNAVFIFTTVRASLVNASNSNCPLAVFERLCNVTSISYMSLENFMFFMFIIKLTYMLAVFENHLI